MIYARDLVRRSLMLIGVLQEGETPSASQLKDGIDTLNDLLGSLSGENLVIPNGVIEQFDLVQGQQTYTMGPSGNFNTVRPMQIVAASVVDTNSTPSTEVGLTLVNLQGWSEIQTKGMTGMPQKLFNDGTNPLTSLNVWPIPDVARKINLTSLKPLLTIANGNTQIDLAPPYAKFLRFNLAVDLAPEYGVSVSAEVAKGAEDSKANVKRGNISTQQLKMDPIGPQRGAFNIYTGGYN